ncbi:hypothetical protein AAVH_18091 [Aphelenchoides avenae]|nr:hypothetical protein AAVH_18091 [Aphelenchus avenae]
MQFRRAQFRDKLLLCLRRSVINVVELNGIGVNEKFLTMLARGFDETLQTKQVTLKDVVFPSPSMAKLLLASFRELKSVRVEEGLTSNRPILDEMLHYCGQNGVPEFHSNGGLAASPDAIVKFCFAGRDLPNETRKLRFPSAVAEFLHPRTFGDDVIEV